jgi:hypothetical protein
MAEFVPPRCEVIPLPEQQFSLQIEGREVARWNASPSAPRPFLYPVLGPSGACLTRMGHPGAPNHDHHRSIWFAHNKLLGIDFWSEDTAARIRQTGWLVLEDGPRSVMAVTLGWFDGHDPQPLLEQETILVLQPLADGEYLLDWQLRFTPRSAQLEFQQSNFGFLAVRVAKSISAVFGGGQLTDSEGRTGEKAIFAQAAKWVDYSGPVVTAVQRTVVEGITYFDHPDNPTYPSHWHVRDDGWMGCAPCLKQGIVIEKEKPLELRYGMWVHSGPVDATRVAAAIGVWSQIPKLSVHKGTKPHHQFELEETPQS